MQDRFTYWINGARPAHDGGEREEVTDIFRLFQATPPARAGEKPRAAILGADINAGQLSPGEKFGGVNVHSCRATLWKRNICISLLFGVHASRSSYRTKPTISAPGKTDQLRGYLP